METENVDGQAAVCPVMGHSVDKKQAEADGLIRTFNGQAYYFCCNMCADSFDKDPAKYSQSQASGHNHRSHGC